MPTAKRRGIADGSYKALHPDSRNASPDTGPKYWPSAFAQRHRPGSNDGFARATVDIARGAWRRSFLQVDRRGLPCRHAHRHVCRHTHVHVLGRCTMAIIRIFVPGWSEYAATSGFYLQRRLAIRAKWPIEIFAFGWCVAPFFGQVYVHGRDQSPPHTALCPCAHVQAIRQAHLLDGAVSS